MADQLVAQGLAAFEHRRVGAQRMREVRQAGIEVDPGRVRGILADLVQNPLELADELIVDFPVDEFRHPPWASLLDSLVDRVPVPFELLAAELHELIDQGFGVIAGCQYIDQRCERAVDRHLSKCVLEAAVQRVAQFRAVYGPHEPVEHHGQVAAELAGVGVALEPLTEPLGEIDAQEPRLDGLPDEEVLADESCERTADLVLALRNDGGVRNRQAERMPEERRHGKPVREPADDRRFGERPDHTEPGVGLAQHARDDEECRGSDQQSGRHPFHAAQALFERAVPVVHAKPIEPAD